MFRVRAIIILALFLFAVVGRGFRPRAAENPFHGMATYSANAAETVDDAPDTDDEYGPMKPFKAKRKAQSPSVQTLNLIVVLVHSYGSSWRFLLSPVSAPDSLRSAPELRPPIAVA
jgi:hypothetical protein